MPSLGDQLARVPKLRLVLAVGVCVLVVFHATRAVATVASLTSSVLVPALVAVLFTGLLMPLQVLLNHRLRLNRHLAAAVTLLIAIGGVGALLSVSGYQLATGMTDLKETALSQVTSIKQWIVDSPLPVGREEINGSLDAAAGWLSDRQGDLAQGALGIGYTAGSFLFGVFLCLVMVFFFLAQGDRIWSWILGLVPRAHRERAFEASRRGWVTLGTYTKMQVVIAGADAVGIGLGAWALGLPLVLPLTAVTFVLCFVPVVGAVVSGALVTLVALAFGGTGTALLMLLVVIVVQQLESDVLSPVLMGKAVNVHPIAVLVAVAGGTYLVGFLGALFAVPLVAVVNTVGKYYAGRDPFPLLDEGGSALTDRPGRLVGSVTKIKLPPRLGEASPRWLERARLEAHGG